MSSMLKLEVDVGDPKERRVRESQVVVVACAKTNVGALVQLHAGKAMRQGTAGLRQLCLKRSKGAVGGPVVDYDDFVPRIPRHCRNNRGQIFFEQVAAIPVRDHDARGTVFRLRVGVRILGLAPSAAQSREDIR